MARDDENMQEDTATEEQMREEASQAMGQADAAQKEIADLKAKLIRWQADFQNYQRRAAVEYGNAKSIADADFAKSLLNVLDHFDMAVNVDPAKTDTKSLLE